MNQPPQSPDLSIIDLYNLFLPYVLHFHLCFHMFKKKNAAALPYFLTFLLLYIILVPNPLPLYFKTLLDK